MSLEGIRKHLTYANVMATLAIFVVLGGGAYAATKTPNNSVGTKQIKKNAVTTVKLKNGTVTGAKVKKGTLLATNFKSGQLPKGATGAKGANGATGPAGPKGTTGTTGSTGILAANTGGGEDPRSLFSPTSQEMLANLFITVDKPSDLMVWGSMGDYRVLCSASRCEGVNPSDSTNIGIYLDGNPDLTSPAPISHTGIAIEGASLNQVEVPPLSGVLRDVAPGTYQVKLILSSFGITTSSIHVGGGEPWVTAMATSPSPPP